MKKKGLFALLAVIVLGGGVFALVSGGGSANEKYAPKITAAPSGGETVSMLSGSIYEVTANYEKYITTDYLTGQDIFAPDKVTIAWECAQEAQYYTLNIATNKELKDAKSFVTMDTSVEFETLYAGMHYYYQIEAKCEGMTLKSQIFDFYTEHLPRTVSIEGVSNTRDLGGYYTEDGKGRIRQGLVYRGGTLADITEKGKEQILYTYRVKTDLDLRGEGQTASPLGDAVQFVNYKCPWYYGHNSAINAPDYIPGLRNAIRMFANEENYPMYVHCSLGRDRTGTICFLINALCGVGEKDLFMDYEVSFMSVKGCADNQTPRYMVGDGVFGGLYNYINSYEGMEGTLAEKTEAYMLDLGITQDEIDSIRRILVEEVQ